MPNREGGDLPESLEILLGFLGDEELTTRIARLEGLHPGDVEDEISDS